MNAPASEAASLLPPDLVRIAVDASTEPFWQAAKDRRLCAPKCGECATFRMPPTPICPICQSRDMVWVQLSGRATVYSFAVVRGFPGLPDITLVGAILDLPDAPGARIVSSIVDVDPADVTIGMAVEVDFSPIADGWLRPIFRPVSSTEEN